MSESTVWSGSLAPRKKADLLELQHALGLPVDSSLTKPEILENLKSYIDANEIVLIEDPRFKGLYGRKGSRKQTGSVIPTAYDSDNEGSSPVAVVPYRSRTKQTFRKSTEAESVPRELEAPETPSRIPLPGSAFSSPSRLLSSAVARVRPEMDIVVANVNRTAEQFEQKTDKALTATRQFMSSSPNIATLSIIWEALILLYAYIPWATQNITFIPPGYDSAVSFGVPYPPASVFLSRDLYTLLAEWAIPTIVLPVIFGAVISFRGRKDVDPVSSGIVRLVSAVASQWGVPEQLLSPKTRILSAATALSFAVAEAVSQPAPLAEQTAKPTKPVRGLLTGS